MPAKVSMWCVICRRSAAFFSPASKCWIQSGPESLVFPRLVSDSSFLVFFMQREWPANLLMSLLERASTQQRSLRLTSHLRHPNQPSQSDRSKARVELCVSALS
jgi:hypothetical protein